MMNIIQEYIKRIKNTKKFAREQNVPVWEIPLINSVGLIILGSIYLGFMSWGLLSQMQFHDKPYWLDVLEETSGYLPMIYALTITLTALDKVLILMIRFQSRITKIIYTAIQKLDHKMKDTKNLLQ